uniref:Uncharacterized protein n=1 Tax=viral metagenome TaxID=1070528 RepID=A0A6C0I7L8_9ZZZZ
MSSENKDTREWLEGEAYQEKQFEDYLRLNPVDEQEEEECPPLGVATAENVARARMILGTMEHLETEHLVHENTRCRCDDSEPMEYITCCHCGFKECEIYSFRYKSSLYCNNCAYDVCGILIDKPKYSFNIDDELYKFNKKNGTKFDNEQHAIFVQFQKKYDLTVDEAFDYIQGCHCCAGQIRNLGDEFCSDKCEQYFEYECPDCIYKQCDLVCKICIYNDRRASYDERNGGYGGNDGGYYPEEERAVEAVVNCYNCQAETLCRDRVYNNNKQWLCEECAYDCDEKLLAPYSEEQREEIYKYTERHNLTIEEAIDYQTHCHCCGNEVTNPVFDADNHQYCKERCFEYCEEYRYECSRGQECRVCNLWEYHKTRNNMYAQMYDSIDMSEYNEPE